jgi:hypothetical protein
MRRFTCLALLLLVRPLAAADDPGGTIVLDLEVGDTAPVTATPGANVLCDDLRVVAPEFSADGNEFVLRALRPGSTLCGIWLAGQKPGGLYRVRVAAKKSEEKKKDPPEHGDGGPQDAGG